MYAVSDHNLTSTPVVAFLHKLWVLVNDETYDHLICWGEVRTFVSNIYLHCFLGLNWHTCYLNSFLLKVSHVF